MLTVIWRSIVVTALLALIVCGAYPLAVMGVGKILFREKANGSLVTLPDGRVVGSRLIGQNFTRPEYIHGRPSAAGNGYDAANSSGSNLGPTNPKLADAVKTNVQRVLQENPGLQPGQVPTDLVTASASGLDPHVSPSGALVQVERVAKARNAQVDEVRKLVQAHVEGRQLGIFGEPVVNVLLVNLDLDQRFPVNKKR